QRGQVHVDRERPDGREQAQHEGQAQEGMLHGASGKWDAKYRDGDNAVRMTSNSKTLADLRAGRLAGATHLDLRHCGLEEFPREILGLAETLVTLDLSSNRLRALPDELPRLRALRTLFCSANAFETLPGVLGRC